MKHVLFYILIIALCACNTKGQQSLSSSVAESTCVIKLKNLQNGYNVSFIREEDGCTIKFCKGDSVNLYIETARLPRCLSEYDSVYGKYTVDVDIPIVKLDTLDINKYNIADIFFMDVNFDGKEDFIYTELGNGKLLYECYDIENEVVEGKKPKLVKPLEEEPYNMFASGSIPEASDYTVFDYQKKEIFIYTTSGCCTYYNTWAKLLEGGNHGDKPYVKVVKQERHSFQKEGDGGIETVETYVLTNDSSRITGTRITGTDTVLKTKLFGLKVRYFNNFCLLIAFTRSIHALFSKDETGTSPWRFLASLCTYLAKRNRRQSR